MSAMTLEQVLEILRNAANEKHAIGSSMCAVLADVIDAHLAQPAQSVDIRAIREVIAYLKKGHRFDAEMADKLTAALPESKP